jgi:predicted nucleic acid-binding protein
MADYYGDSSALIKRHVVERGSAWFRALVAPAGLNRIITSRLSLVEVYSALNRRRREASLTALDYVDMSGEFTRLARTEYRILELTGAIVEQARALLERHPLRAGDSVQLASAMIADLALRNAALAPLTFLAADSNLLTAARAEGLAVEDLNTYP